MAKKKLQSGLELSGIAPNILLKHVESTAPFLFNGEINTDGEKRGYLAKLKFYKKNLNQIKNINLTEYFSICMAAHWSTAGTYVPTDVDNQIRETLWRHGEIGRHIEKMARVTIESWTWDYSPMTNRKSYNESGDLVMSTHEGTWLSVAIGAYCALVENNRTALASEMADTIIAEAFKEENLLLELQKKEDAINFLRTCALMAHNFGDLDRVIDQWKMKEDDPFRLRIYKLGHKLNIHHSPVLYFAGLVNKEFLSVENHRHMSLRQPKCLRKSQKYLVPVGPFMDTWGEMIGNDRDLSFEDKTEVIIALYEGYKRQDKAFGYIRAFSGILSTFPDGLRTIEGLLPFDLVLEIKDSPFYKLAQITKDEFEADMFLKLKNFRSELVDYKF